MPTISGRTTDRRRTAKVAVSLLAGATTIGTLAAPAAATYGHHRHSPVSYHQPAPVAGSPFGGSPFGVSQIGAGPFNLSVPPQLQFLHSQMCGAVPAPSPFGASWNSSSSFRFRGQHNWGSRFGRSGRWGPMTAPTPWFCVVYPAAPKIGPIVPKVLPKVAPKVVPKVAPKVVPKVAPKAVPKVVPKVLPKVAPKVTPTVTPKGEVKVEPVLPVTAKAAFGDTVRVSGAWSSLGGK